MWNHNSQALIKITFTYPEPIHGEVALIVELLSSSVDFLHIRKPYFNEEMTATFIGQIPELLHSRCVIHHHYELSEKFNLAGINLRCSEMDARKNTDELLKKVHSCSAHSIQELKALRYVPSYVFLSPVFDSISKPGYRSQFEVSELRNFLRSTSQKVIALGGVDDSRIPMIQDLGFSGYAQLGSIWSFDQRTAITTEVDGN